MKYIRTKDGHIFPLQIKTSEEYMYQERGEFYSSKIIAQADTIEELCDEFVIVADDKPFVSCNMKNVRDMAKYTQVYGAIWTDKGLIYVAKLNEKGELELL